MNRLSIFFMGLVIFIILLLVWKPFEKTMQSTTEVRAAMDIGSGATNIKIANVDTKTNKIVSKIYEQSIQVPYQRELEQSSDNTFSQEVMDQGTAAIKELKTAAERYHVKKVVAVATAAFRQADNAQRFADRIEKETGVHVRIINQDEEGVLAFRGALAVSSLKAENTVVWDIGGGSMQLTTLTNEGTYFVEKGKIASIPFKNAIISEIEHKDLKTTTTPNPISKEDMHSALMYATQSADESSLFIKNKLTAPETSVIAVGNLFNYGIKTLADNKEVVHVDALQNATDKLLGKTDAELNQGALSEVAVSNPILVLGYMNGLHISKVNIVNINNADGALTTPAYWGD